MKIGLPAAIMSHMLVVPPLDGSDTFVVEQYYVALNDAVVAGQPFALVRSERWAWDVPATTGGVIGALLVEPGGTIARGAALVELRDQRPMTNDQRPTTEDEQIDVGEGIAMHQGAAAPRVRATPVARRMIAAHGLDLAALRGTGRGNVVTRTDVLALIREQGTGDREQEIKNKEQETINEQQTIVITKQNEDAAQEIFDLQSSISNLQFPQRSDVPYALTAIEADLAAVLTTIHQHADRSARRGVTISTTACVAAACVAALGEHRLLNSAWHDDGVILRSRVHLQIEHRTPSGMHTALVPDAADLNAVGIARRLAQAAPNEEIEQQAATFVIVEHGEPWWAHALPHGTCTAQLGVGAIVEQARVVATAHGDQIIVRPTIVLTLAYDARVIDQPAADAFVGAVKQRLEYLHSL